MKRPAGGHMEGQMEGCELAVRRIYVFSPLCSRVGKNMHSTSTPSIPTIRQTPIPHCQELEPLTAHGTTR